jgi:hypothetical protein
VEDPAVEDGEEPQIEEAQPEDDFDADEPGTLRTARDETSTLGRTLG